MQRLIFAAAILCLFTIPAHAQINPRPSPNPVIVDVCCQKGVTFGPPNPANPPTCEQIPATTVGMIGQCKGGAIVSGTCEPDGACDGSWVCCEGLNSNGQPNGWCRPATESACDAVSPAGQPNTTKSVPGAQCPGLPAGGDIPVGPCDRGLSARLKSGLK